ncbi:hypothetical protein EI94DRAFT_1720854 [Lactarius quietus]|nr:hypothetical protein EI94DRAFT_1720854 [Lactarius quietus]
MQSWETPFIGTSTLRALERHVVEVSKEWTYGPFCPIVQSSGTGKSRLVDEFAKTNFLIPINLRKEGDEGFPPPDNAIRNLLTQGSNDIYLTMLHFLFELFEKTSSVITDDLKEVTTRSEQIKQFREFMTNGQSMNGTGKNRQKFYQEIAVAVDTRMRTRKKISPEQVQGALLKLISHISPQSCPQTDDCTAELPHVFITFDEAHSLTNILSTMNRTHYTELCSVLKDVDSVSFFVFFLSTTSKILRLSMPKKVTSMSTRMLEDPMPSLPFCDLGFDHLMHDHKIFNKFKTVEDVTATECVVSMGRPLWGTTYDSIEIQNQSGILGFAITKLLCSSQYHYGLRFTSDQHCAVLSQRLALDINSSAYITSGLAGDSTRDCHMLKKVQLQIANHLRVCISIPQNLASASKSASMHSIAASEPILSEAASYIMRNYSHFCLPDALLDVLDSYAITHGQQGELLVAAVFTRARDLYVEQIKGQLVPYQVTPLCPSSQLHFRTMSDSLPSVCHPDFSLQNFGDVFKNTKMHFNHMIQPLGLKDISRLYLLRIMARGAAALCTNCQPGYDMVYPFLYDTSDLVLKKVGFIMVLVKSYVTYKEPDPKLFRKMDPVLCGLLKKADYRDFTIPIIRIVFTLGGEQSSLKHMTYKSPTRLGAATLPVDAAQYPKFTSYDFWCSGIGPDLLQPVHECDAKAQSKWEALLRKTNKSYAMFSNPKLAPGSDSNVRWSQYPGGGDDKAHYDAWMEDDGDDENEDDESEG